MVLFFDTETTGLFPGEICQLSYIMQTKEKTEGKNFFFSVNNMSPEAQAVHGFSVEKLKELSLGKDFSFFLNEISKDFLAADVIIAHNFKFDEMFLRASFERNYDSFLYNESLCTMKTFTPICKLKRENHRGYKYPRLNELCAFFGITEGDVRDFTVKLFGENVGGHDARFDTAAVCLSVKRALQMGYLEKIAEFI